MKLLITIILLLSIIECNAQNTYDNKIGEVKELNVYGKDAKVVIGKIIINQTIRTQINFSGSTTTKDSVGLYVTKYTFIPVDNPGTFNVNLQIQFNYALVPFIDIGGPPFPLAVKIINGTAQTSEQWTPDLTAISVKGTITGDGIIIIVKSKVPLFATMYGVAGKSN